ncbi:hypothetical protein GGI42DRAFT_326508 [Trichoderma sp. SZMC 28013]
MLFLLATQFAALVNGQTRSDRFISLFHVSTLCCNCAVQCCTSYCSESKQASWMQFSGASKAFLPPYRRFGPTGHTMDEPPKCGGCEMKLRNAAGFTFRRWRTNDARQGSQGSWSHCARPTWDPWKWLAGGKRV